MKVKDIFAKTSKFIWLKLAMGAGLTVVAALLLALFLFLGSLMGDAGTIIMGLIWIIVVFAIYRLAMHYFGYLIKAGHIAVISEICTTGNVPDDMFNFGKEKVKAKFATSNVYFVIDKLVSGAVSQL